MKNNTLEISLVILFAICLMIASFYTGVFFTKVEAVKNKMGYWKVDNYANVTFAWSTNLLTPEVLK
jgi:hypothetical protein